MTPAFDFACTDREEKKRNTLLVASSFVSVPIVYLR